MVRIKSAFPRSAQVKRQDILDILAEHQKYRNIVRENGEPVMGDEEFLNELYKIVPEGYGIVDSKAVAAIYGLRAEYECIPAGKNGYRPKYGTSAVRTQVKNGLLFPLTDDELYAAFGRRQMHASQFYVVDVLRRPLGRWPVQKRLPEEAEKSVSRTVERGIKLGQRRIAHSAMQAHREGLMLAILKADNAIAMYKSNSAGRYEPIGDYSNEDVEKLLQGFELLMPLSLRTGDGTSGVYVPDVSYEKKKKTTEHSA